MSVILNRVLVWAEQELPEGECRWISDLRSEAKHISGSVARQRFLWSGVLAAMGQILRLKFGVRRVGQMLLGLAILGLSLVLTLAAGNIENGVVKTAFYFVMPLYLLTGGLALLNLGWMKRFTIFCSLAFGVLWAVLGLDVFSTMDAPIAFLRAFTLEVSFFMAGLFIAASYLGWVEDAGHA